VLEGALGFLLVVMWLGAFVALLAWVTGRAQRRRHGGRALHLIPWYLGGEMDVHVDPPKSSRGPRSDR
jgi:hypothetical protein